MNIRSSANISMRETNRTYRYNNTGVLSLTIRRPEIRLPSRPEAQANINRRFALEAGRFYRHASSELYRQAVRSYQNAQKNGFLSSRTKRLCSLILHTICPAASAVTTTDTSSRAAPTEARSGRQIHSALRQETESLCPTTSTSDMITAAFCWVR